jgi:molybdenum cofactor cytidylyltransferase
MMALQGDRGAQQLLASHTGQVVEIEADDEAPVTDIDTSDALAAYRGRRATSTA